MQWIQQDKGCRLPGIPRAFATRIEVESGALIRRVQEKFFGLGASTEILEAGNLCHQGT
jgi:hypothetical protein